MLHKKSAKATDLALIRFRKGSICILHFRRI